MKSALLTVSSLAVVTIATSCAHAKTLYTTSFEPPSFKSGLLDGQNGWGSFGDDSATAVQNYFAYSGTHSVVISAQLAEGDQSGAFKEVSTSAPVVEQTTELYLANSSVKSVWQFSGLGGGLDPYIGGVNIFPDDKIQLQTVGFPVLTTQFVRNQWNKLSLIFDFETQKYTVELNDAIVASGVAFCGADFGCSGARVASYGGGLFDSANNQNANDVGFFDDYSVTSVPIPPSLPLFGCAILGLAGVGYIAKHNKSVAKP